MANPGSQIDTDLYSRQIGTFGMETMGKLMQMRVFISGLRGLGAEVAKNLILAGPAAVVLHDDAIVEARDLGANFYLRDGDVGKKSRAKACAPDLAKLNPYVSVTVSEGVITEERLSGFAVVVLLDASQADLVKWNEFCRKQSPPTGFITADCYGLAGRVFVDFGDSFVCRDADGEEPKSAIVAAVTQDSPGAVHTHNDRRHGFQDGDWVTFREVQGMTQLNDSKPRQIKVIAPYSFTIEDTTGYSQYQREGIVSQVKVPHTVKFISYAQSCLQPTPPGGADLAVPDLAKFGRSEQLHIAWQALLRYREQQGQPPIARNGASADACVKIAMELNAERKAMGAEKALFVDEVDVDVITKVALYARCMICPMASFIGGVVAQEVVKFTGKYAPLQQCLYLDMFELAPPADLGSWKPVGDRYDDQVAIFGSSFQEALGDMRLFLVGAGALGCEYLKCFAMMGACCGNKGCATVTDMDRIETSNLNRQFLFRKEDVGKSKSFTAAAVAAEMNPALKVVAREVRVGTDTEDTFDDAFWESLDSIVNALDNIDARMYVDSRCVWFCKPLLESGTLGTKANSQVILPHITQSYADSQDPPEESIPLCTLKHFPNAIEHTIEWARDLFEQMFAECPNEVNTFLTDPQALISKVIREGSGSSQLSRLNAIKRALDDQQKAFDVCVRFAMLEFQDKFDHSIAQLLHTFPLDHKTGEGAVFWSGPKRPPAPIAFDAAEELHLDFVMSAGNLYAAVLGVAPCPDREKVRGMASKVQTTLSGFKPKDVNIKVDDKDTTQEGCVDDDEKAQTLANEMMASMSKSSSSGQRPVRPAEFEKDDDTNFHVRFIYATANLRARNYKIQEVDFHKVKMIAGKIIPAIATTTAMVTGLVSAELLKLVTRSTRKVEDFKNSFVNLALPLWVLSEPLPPVQSKSKEYDPVVMGPVRARPEGFTTWDKVTLDKGDLTFKEFMDHLARDYDVSISIISAGNACLYNSFSASHKKRLASKVSEVWQEVTKQTVSPKMTYITLMVCASDLDDDVEVQLPAIKYVFRSSNAGSGSAGSAGPTGSAGSPSAGAPWQRSQAPPSGGGGMRCCPRRAS